MAEAEDYYENLRVMGERAKENLRNGHLYATGYRVVVKPVEIKNQLEGAQAEQFPTLAGKGLQHMTDQERDRHQRSSNHGVVTDIGPDAFTGPKFKSGAWVEVGDLIVHSRHAGTRVEHPPGTGVFYQVVNDEDIFGKIE